MMEVNAGWFTGRPPAVESPKTKVEGMLRQIGDDFYKALGNISSDFIPVIKREAQSRGIDPLYLIYLLFDRHKDWKRVVGKNWLPMTLVRDVANDWSNDIPDWSEFRFPEPDKEKDADEAIKAVGRWAGTVWAKSAMDLFMQALKKQQKVAEYTIKHDFRQNVNSRQVSCWLINQMTETLDNKPRLWPRYHQILWTFINRLFAQKGLSCPL
jgi:hypothetical protein